MKAKGIIDFFYWIGARHEIYLNRAAGYPWPWTTDPILQKYKFTNAFRELDRGTIWCREEIREPYANHPELFFNIATYRRYNWTGTQACVGFIKDYGPERRDRITKFFLKRRAQGIKIFTGAHMLCGNIKDPLTGIMPDNKVEQIFNISFRILWDKRRELEPRIGKDNLQSAFKRIMDGKIPGFGAFIAYEIVSDLRWTRYLDTANDILTWANPGPGAKRGIQRIYGVNPPKSVLGFSTQDYVQAMRYLLEISPKYLDESVPQLEMREIEHSLCEFDKYQRVLKGEGRPREQYVYKGE